MEYLTTPLIIAVLVITANFVVRLIRPGFSKRRHILWSVFAPAVLLWLLVTATLWSANLAGNVEGGLGTTLFIGFVSAIAMLALSAMIGLPITYLILKLTKWFE